ncbi:hypothetical protein SISNIDRAFT_549743 [Sistotremastrum niveocremeum HHB9708]|uniref:Gfd2/YDR514C-like C-terminal domain-containing protein n=1 Tax=Sistotremastrum niveocremeum HHB9708 TaxID=1314777 RepID=A0A164UMN4_9AGAM|nr:hypothetical protein SISNIDRAFT_549743 [Sistotremastrum niveocremeum HHB9708]
MSSGFQLVDVEGWEWDLQSVYSAYMGYFQARNIAWWERSWGQLFSSFEEFLNFGWPVVVVTDVWTNRAHIVTRTTSIGAFLKMIKTRYGDVLPTADNMLRIRPFETQQRPLRTVNDWNSYRKLHATLPSAVLAALKIRVRSGEPKAIKELWEKRDHTFLAIDFEWSERNNSSCLEFGYSALRCGFLNTLGIWPPEPDVNYRKGHFVVAEYIDKVHNKRTPTVPWEYAWGDTQVIPKAKLPEIIQAIISSLSSPDSETTPNTLILVAHGVSGDLERLHEMKIKLPNNTMIIDTSTFERQLFNTGLRSHVTMSGSNGQIRQQGSTLSLGNLLRTLNVDIQCALHNSGNDAFLALLALQLLLDPTGVPMPVPMKKTRHVAFSGSRSSSYEGTPSAYGASNAAPMVTVYPGASRLLPPTSPEFAQSNQETGGFDA